MWNKVPSFLKNKYLAVVFLFVLWMLFFDRNSVIEQYKLKHTLKEHEQKRDYYQNEISNDSLTLYGLSSDTQNLIRFAREKYLMKKDNEDVYLIIEDKE